ncbi:SpoIIE family protein phosphatase [Geodermatophilus sabuli]|uniref:PAS domain S-box-containing protein n=1 Tax=Geodermatophilus sabuli TaxID=1564158 RepID=A0A285EIJ7_9ACTN|nr:SpoIIE family protein phosphatase [Geodermatophilus sabuli]MBB3086809.1 PAS domain S-box-containing protein [Geodermatophilus sabuli]SNX98817.1 PAS domain S-box-containing protein [Geodermatophilus sabuli]
MASPLPSPLPRGVDVLRDPHRIAAARRLLVEVAGPAAFDRLSALAARLVGAGHAKVTILTDQDTVVGGYGLPPGVIGGPALLTGAISAITVRRGAPLVVPDAAALSAVADLPAVTSGQVAAYLGVPLVADSGHVVGVLAVYDPVPRAWSVNDAALLEQLAASVIAELELSAARTAIGTSLARLDIALEASSIGIWERDLRTGAMRWDERCAALFGLDGAVEHDSLEEVLADHVHPDDQAAVAEAMRSAIAQRSAFMIEARMCRVDGGVVWTVSRGRVITDPRGEPVRVLGTVIDVTAAREEAARRMSAVQRAAAIAEVAAELANATRIPQLAEIALRGARVLGADAIGLATRDPEDGRLYLHLTRRILEVVATEADVVLPPGGVPMDDDELPIQYVAEHGERMLFADAASAEARFPRLAGINDVLGTRALATFPLRVEGRLIGSFTVVWTTEHSFTEPDVELLEAFAAQIALTTSRLQADRVRAEAVAAMAAANSRLQLLADAGRVLSGSLDISQQVGQLADLVVPTLGDWCWLVVTDEQGRMHEMASAHRDPALRAELELYVHSMVTVMTEQAAARVVTRTGRPLVLPEIDVARIEAALPEAATRQLLDRLGVASGVIVPLVARGQTLGALGLFGGPGRAPHAQAEIDTAVEVGRRAGLALHHARLYGQQRVLADALQHSMLTAPPEPDHCEIVVRYVPAAAGAEIGGDWYDAFLEAGGATVLAIGDVVGHDSRAAAAMGQLRGLLRGISYSSGAAPSQVLAELDRAIRGLALDTVATSLVARLEQEDADLRLDRTRLRWSSAGHPPPVVLSPDGEVRVLDGLPADLLLGVDPSTPRSDRLVDLPAGSTVFLYTDGLVERRGWDLDAGTDALLAVLCEYADLPLEALCDLVLERLFLPDAEDDVALLAVRLHTQTEPRPAEAGPQILPPGIEPAPEVNPEAGVDR